MECWEYQNKYDVFDQQGGNIFFLKEESGCLDRCCCANARALEVSFQDLQGNELLRFDRPLRCMEMPCDCCYPNYTQVCISFDVMEFQFIHISVKQLLEIYHQDRLLGKIREVPQCCARKHLEVFDQKDQKIFDISGPCCPISCGGDVNFPVCTFRSSLFLENDLVFYRLRIPEEFPLEKSLRNGEDCVPKVSLTQILSKLIFLWEQM